MAANVSPDFTPIRSELANAHGFSRGLLNFVVLSADQPFTRAPAWALVFVALLFLLLLVRTVRLPSLSLRPGKADPTYQTGRYISGLAVAFLTAVALSPFVTRYRV